MIGAVALGHRARVRGLVVVAHVEADREGLDRLVREPRHGRDDRARVDAAREERAHRNVAAQAQGRGLDQGLADPLAHLLHARRRLAVAIGEAPVAAQRDLAVLPGEGMRRRQLAQRGEGAQRRGHALVVQIEVERCVVEVARHALVDEDRPELGGEPEPSPPLGVEQGLLAYAVARQQEAPPAPVPEREREHPAQRLDAGVAELLVEVDDHLGVRPRREAVAARGQLLAQLAVVVDLAVADHDHVAVLAGDRLVAAVDVDHGQAGDTYRHPFVREHAARVGPAVSQGLAHALDQPRLDRAVAVERAGDPAHRLGVSHPARGLARRVGEAALGAPPQPHALA